MDIKEIAEQVSKRIYVEDGLLLSKFISEKFAESLFESYKAELLKEAGEPTCWMTPDGEGWRMRTKPPETDTKLGWMEFYTSDQVAAAVAKATKPLEDQLAKAEQRVVSQYYFKNNSCKAESANDPDCICWHDEGTGPMQPLLDGTYLVQMTWRKFVKEV